MKLVNMILTENVENLQIKNESFQSFVKEIVNFFFLSSYIEYHWVLRIWCDCETEKMLRLGDKS